MASKKREQNNQVSKELSATGLGSGIAGVRRGLTDNNVRGGFSHRV